MHSTKEVYRVRPAYVFTHKVQFRVSGSGLAQAGMQTSYACQGDKLDLVCPQGTVIRVMRANYGRFSVGICNEHGITDWSVNCMAPRSLRILQDRYERIMMALWYSDSQSPDKIWGNLCLCWLSFNCQLLLGRCWAWLKIHKICMKTYNFI